MSVVEREPDLVVLERKIDYLTELLEEQRARQSAFEELKQDLIPIFNQLFRLTVEELDEIGNDFQLEDLLYLIKRLLRDTNLIIGMLDQVESTMALGEELGRLSRPMFIQMVELLDRLEREGYFSFARSAWYVMEQVVSEFTDEDVRALGDNIVTILMTIRHMTQPEVMSLLNGVVDAVAQDEVVPDDDISTWQLIRELGDPKVRKGLVRLLGVVKTLAEQPKPGNEN